MMLRLASCHRDAGNPRAPSGVPGPSWRSEARISSRKALQLKDEIVASPVITEIYDPERVKLAMELETSGLVEFRLPGMGGESSSLVTKVDRPKRTGGIESANVGNGGGNVGNNGGNVGNGDGDVGNDDGNVDRVEDIGRRPDTTSQVLLRLKSNPKMSAATLAEDVGLSTRQVERILRGLREEGRIVRVGGARGHWKVNP